MTNTTTDQQLAARALAVRKSAYGHYSGFKVGAALLDDKGHVHVGCNVENAAYPQGSCAETGAIAAMVASGGKRIRTIAVAGGREQVSTCADTNTRILVLNDADSWQSFSIQDLLPASFKLD